MKPQEVKSMCQFASELFADLKPEQLKVLGEKFTGFDKGNVEAALKTHRIAHVFFDFPGFFEGVRAEHARSQLRVKAHQDEKIHQWLARQPAYRGTKASEAIDQHFRQCWDATKGEPVDDNSKQLVRRLIRGHARAALMQIGWAEPDVSEFADDFVGLEPGQRIVTRKLFRDVAEVMVNAKPQEAIEQLVGA